MITELENGKIRIEPSDWRFSATIVGLAKYFDYHNISFDKNDDYIEFDQSSLDDDRYLQFVEYHFAESMHHRIIENLLNNEVLTEAQMKRGKEKAAANSVMKKFFKEISFNIDNKQEIQSIITQNRNELIKDTYKGGQSLYANYCNTNCLLADKKDSCRLLGYSIDMGKKGKSVAFASWLLISPSWNVNVVKNDVICQSMLLLISPSWNVNFLFYLFALLKVYLLISPSWNVNFISILFFITTQHAFNLTKLECK